MSPEPIKPAQRGGSAAPPHIANATAARKRRTLAATGVTLVSCAAGVVMLNLLGARFHARLDATATGEQQLAPRTRTLLESAGAAGSGYRVIVATDLKSIDPRARTNLSDVLDAMHAFRPDFSGTLVDTASPRGVEQFRSLSRELYERDRAQITAQLGTLAQASEAAKGLENDLTATLSPQLLKVREAISETSPQGTQLRTYYENAAAALRVRAGDISRAAGDAARLAPQTPGEDQPIPSTDKAAAALRAPIEGASRDMAALTRELERFIKAGSAQGSTIEPAAVEAARIALGQASQARDRSAVLLESLKTIARLDATRVADVLKAGSAALVLAPRGGGVVAIDIPSVLPSSAWLDAAQAGNNDLRRRVEDIVATSIASLASPTRPILVLTHAEQRPMLLEAGWTDALRERLSLRGIDCVEWCVNTSPAPDLSGLPESEHRPKVYLTLATNDSAAAPTQGAMTGAQRAARLADEVGKLLDKGTPVIISLAPSMLPTYGEKDPISSVLARFGIDARTGTPLLSETLTQRGRAAETDRIAQGTVTGPGAHALAGALRGVPTYLTWAVPIEAAPAPGAGAHAWPILTVPLSTSTPPTTWGESEWQRLRSVRREERGLLPDSPSFTPGRDAASPQKPLPGADGWTVVAAAEAPAAAGAPARLVVVGSNDWFIDQVTQQGTMVDGRPAFQNPGNLELLENAVLWLTHQDQLIAQSATARTTPIVKAIPDAPLRTLRIAIIAGLPALVLVAGALLRTLRR